MEYLEGPVAKNVPLENLRKNVEPLQSFYFESLFRYNVLHGDFHLGNIIIMDDGNKIGIIDFGIVHFLTDEDSNKLFDIMFLTTTNNNNNINTFYKILKVSIRFICSDKNQHETIYEQLNQDKEFEALIRYNDYSANMLIKIINKIMSLENVELKSNVCELFLSAMSGLQTVEYVNNNMNLTDLTKTFMNRSIKMD